jgi:cytochrome c-type biogenesis protein CcmH
MKIKLNLLIIFFIFNFNVVIAENNKIDESKIFKNIRCLICQGQSVADSNSEFSQTIKLVVRDQINQGKSEKEIYNFLIEKYGEWIVYNPPFNMDNFVLWLFPYLVLVVGGIIILLLFKKRENRS